MNKLGWIGIGKMGSRMANRLLEAGYDLVVCDISKKQAQPLIDRGAGFKETPKELAAEVDIIFSMIPNHEVLKEIVSGKNGMLESLVKGKIFVDMSTIDPGNSARINTVIEPTGAKFLRATVTGSTAFAETGTLGIMASGEKDIFDLVLPMLKILGNRQRYLGTNEESRFMKICINMMIGTTMQMLAESLVLGEKAGIDWKMMVECIVDSAAASSIVKAKEDALKSRDWSAMATSVMMEKDMAIAMDLAAEYELSLPITAISRQNYAAMRAHDYSELDYSGILLVNEVMNNIKAK